MNPPPLYFVAPFILQSTVWRILMRPFFILFARFETAGLENLTGIAGPVIFAPNHSSEIDSELLPLALPLWGRFSPIFYIVREPSFYNDPVFAWRRHLYSTMPIFLLGAFAIKSGVKDYAVSLARHVRILKDGGSVCIFPEGGFTKTGEIGAAHGGVGYLAHATGCVIVPVLIDGTFKFTFGALFRGMTKIKMTFLPALSPNDFLPSQPQIADYQMLGELVLTKLREQRVLSIAMVKQPLLNNV